jgi:uncharacterized protein (TIGR03437 family)
MDAAQTNIKKIGFFLAIALFLTAPMHGVASVTLTPATTTVNIGNNTSCNSSQTVLLTSSDGTTHITFTAYVSYPNGTSSGDANGAWLYANINGASTETGTTISGNTGASGVTLQIGLNRTFGAPSDTAYVYLTPTGPSGVDTTPIQITVYYAQNTGCAGSPGSVNNGNVSVAPGSVSLAAALGAQQSQALTLTNLTGNSLTFTVSSSGGNWLEYSYNSVTLAGNGTNTVTVTGDGSKLSSSGTVNGTIYITPYLGSNPYGSTIAIPVTFVVGNGTGTGTGGGTLTINGATSNTYTYSFNYTAPALPSQQCISIQDSASGANSYSDQVSTTSGGNWLLANYSLSGTTPTTLTPGVACVTLSLNSTVVPSLASGSYQGTVALTSSSGSTATITVNLYVSGGTAPGVTVSPNSTFTFPGVTAGSTTLQQQQFTITAAGGYSLGTAGVSSAAGWFSMSTPTFSGNTETFTVTANPNGLSAGVYSAVITLASTGPSNGNTTILVSLPVGQGGTGTGGVTSVVAPTTLAFQQQQGNTFWSSLQEAQTITITGQQGSQWSTSIIYGSGGSNWLNFDSPSSGSGTFGSGPASLVVDLFNGVQSLTPSSTPYTATINITTPSGTTSVSVTVLVTSASTAVLFGKPASTTFSSSGGATPAAQSATIVGSDNTGSTSTPPITAGTPTATWISASTSGNTLIISVNPSTLSTGVYSGTIPISASNYSNAINYPVVLIVNGGNGTSGPLTLSTTSLSFTNVTGQISQNLNITASSSTNFTATASAQSCTGTNWLGISPGGSLTASSNNTQISVTVNPSGIGNGTTCSGTISLLTSTGTQSVGVSMTVGTASGGGNVTVSPLQMTFAYTQNQTVPAAQNATIVNASSGTAAIPFTVTTATQSGGSWLQVSAASGSTPLNNPGLSVSVTPGSMNPGTYQGTVTVTPSGGTAQVINVTLTVTGSAVVTASPTTLSLSYLVGGTSPTSTIQVSGGGSAAAFTAIASSTSNFLKVSPASGTTPNTGTFNLAVSADPTVLATLMPGSYSGTITVSGTSPATGTTIVNVTLNVTAPLPTITGVTNAASGAVGAISPGEVISIYANAANPIGPATFVQLNSTTCPSPCTQVPLTMGGVQVVFLPIGAAAPLTFVSAGQINAVVPYSVAGIANLSIEVKYLDQTSNAWPVTLAATAPGVFTANSSGVGPAAVNQYDTTGAYKGINSASNPAQRGWILAIYMTGEGNVSPQPGSGAVTQVSATPPTTPQPFFAPTVLIDSQPASVPGYGEAAGLVSGVLQVNAIVPQGAHSGPVTLSVSLGSGTSQAGVTVNVQ